MQWEVKMDSNDLKRYQRQLLIEGWGEESQQKLAQSTVFIAGAGGLGAPVIYYLAAAGVGCLRIADYDAVDLSNLNRQILYNTNHIGKGKAEIAKKKIQELNPDVEVFSFEQKIDDANIADLVGDASIIIDCLDNFEARRVLNNYAVQTSIPFVHAGVQEMYGQITFIHTPETGCLNCFYPLSDNIPEKKNKPIVGATAGIIGSLVALEAIKFITGIGEVLKNRILMFDGVNIVFDEVELKKNTNCEVCK